MWKGFVGTVERDISEQRKNCSCCWEIEDMQGGAIGCEICVIQGREIWKVRQNKMVT